VAGDHPPSGRGVLPAGGVDVRPRPDNDVSRASLASSGDEASMSGVDTVSESSVGDQATV
jgi:hypothetical protein